MYQVTSCSLLLCIYLVTKCLLMTTSDASILPTNTGAVPTLIHTMSTDHAGNSTCNYTYSWSLSIYLSTLNMISTDASIVPTSTDGGPTEMGTMSTDDAGNSTCNYTCYENI